MHRLDTTRTAQIKDVVIRVLDLDLARDQLVDGMSLYSPIIGMDSMTLLHLLVSFEEEFGIDIDDEDVMNADLVDVGSLVEMVSLLIDDSRDS